MSDRAKLESEIGRAQHNFQRWLDHVRELERRRRIARTRAQVDHLTERIGEAEAAYRDAALTWRYLTTLLDDALGEE